MTMFGTHKHANMTIKCVSSSYLLDFKHLDVPFINLKHQVQCVG